MFSVMYITVVRHYYFVIGQMRIGQMKSNVEKLECLPLSNHLLNLKKIRVSNQYNLCELCLSISIVNFICKMVLRVFTCNQYIALN